MIEAILSIPPIWVAILSMSAIGGISGLVLSVASKVFYVYEDPRISQVENFLAGANCGGCGFTGCSAAAAAVVNGKALPSVCIISDQESVLEVAAIMGVDPGTAEPKLSKNFCLGGNRADDHFHYNGITSCGALAAFYGGKRVCSVGCLGLGDCIKSCAFNAKLLSERKVLYHSFECKKGQGQNTGGY